LVTAIANGVLKGKVTSFNMTTDFFNNPSSFASKPVFIAPLAGVTDVPMREVCEKCGADLTYVEMVSSTALLYDNAKTFEMLARSEGERRLGVQLYGREPDEIARAIELIEKMPFDAVDINMGCPVPKVVKTGAGSAMLKEPLKVLETCKKARSATDKPLSIKIRLGWDRSSLTGMEIAAAAEQAGINWITVHGRTRSEGYGVAVDLEGMRQVRARIKIPMIGNGNIFGREDALLMERAVGVDGFMLARGVLGNPWLIAAIKQAKTEVTVEEWLNVVLLHLMRQEAFYGKDDTGASFRMRKQLIWYASGWPHARQLREKINSLESLSQGRQLVLEFARTLEDQGVRARSLIPSNAAVERYRNHGEEVCCE
jgi:nifR3 family TIM-barrel protein